jgi:hypothetical protein
LYFFKNSDDFNNAAFNALGKKKGEVYVAPLYNQLIQEGKNITFKAVKREDIIFSGTPYEYENISTKIIKDFISKL